MLNKQSQLTRLVAATLPLLLVTFAFACSTVSEVTSKGTSWPLRASADIPAAQGNVTVKNTDGPNRKVKVEVRHLAPPEHLSPNASTYVVWMVQPGETRPRNVGALKVNDDLKGSLELETPFPEFDVFITAEPTPTALSPSSHQLLTASVDTGTGVVR